MLQETAVNLLIDIRICFALYAVFALSCLSVFYVICLFCGVRRFIKRKKDQKNRVPWHQKGSFYNLEEKQRYVSASDPDYQTLQDRDIKEIVDDDRQVTVKKKVEPVDPRRKDYQTLHDISEFETDAIDVKSGSKSALAKEESGERQSQDQQPAGNERQSSASNVGAPKSEPPPEEPIIKAVDMDGPEREKKLAADPFDKNYMTLHGLADIPKDPLPRQQSPIDIKPKLDTVDPMVRDLKVKDVILQRPSPPGKETGQNVKQKPANLLAEDRPSHHNVRNVPIQRVSPKATPVFKFPSPAARKPLDRDAVMKIFQKRPPVAVHKGLIVSRPPPPRPEPKEVLLKVMQNKRTPQPVADKLTKK